MVKDLKQTTYTFRQATHADYNFLYELHAASMRPYVEMLWGWEEAWQQEYFARKFNPDNRQIIQIDSQDAGVLIVEQREQELYIALIELLPEFQRRGVGTDIINNLFRLAQECNRPLTLHVLKSNIPARRLYERLGFVHAGEAEYRLKMIKRP